jgi:hypothetical protein
MSNRLMIVLTAIGIAGSSVPGPALADPLHGAGQARYFSGANAAEQADGAGYAAVGEASYAGHGLGDDGSEPRYHGGPKRAY